MVNIFNQNGKIITISSVKGGVGKTTTTINLAGLYYLMKKKVLIIDLDLYNGGIATCLNVSNKKDIYMLVDALSNNKQVELSDYISIYNNGIHVLPSPKDARDVSKIESKYGSYAVMGDQDKKYKKELLTFTFKVTLLF